MAEHRDKKPMNALLKHTMQVCEQRGFTALVYGKYSYGVNKDSSLAEFKRRNGFTEVRFPRYFVPFSITGRIALSTGLHLGWKNLVPTSVSSFLVAARAKALKATAA
jgi:hypothetical protein